MRTKTPVQADKILQAAGDLFGSQHYHEVRMDDIAAAAQVGKAALYRYFGDKEQLFLAMVGRATDQLLAHLHDAVAAGAGACEKLVKVVETIIRYFDQRPHLFDTIQRAEVMAGPGFPWTKAREKSIVLVSELLAEGKARGEFDIDDPELTALLLLGGVRAVIRFGKQPRPPRLARQIVATWVR